MSNPGISANRRRFLRTAAVSTPALFTTGMLEGVIGNAVASTTASGYSPIFFKPADWAILNHLVDVLIPPGDEGPGGLEAGVAEFIDQQMETPYGRGKLWYMDGPHDPKASPLMGYQLPYAPRDLYTRALPAFAMAIQRDYGRPFAELSEEERIAAVIRIEQGKIVLTNDIPAAAFFAQLLQNVREGYFCDPVYGGNKGMAAWKMVGFPGARGDYYDWVDQYGKKYPLPPVSVK